MKKKQQEKHRFCKRCGVGFENAKGSKYRRRFCSYKCCMLYKRGDKGIMNETLLDALNRKIDTEIDPVDCGIVR